MNPDATLNRATPPASAGRVARWRARAAVHLRSRWPAIRRSLPFDLGVLVIAVVLSRFFAVAWVQTQSVHTTVALIFKGAPVQPGDLVVFNYDGGQLPHYYADADVLAVGRALGSEASAAGPRRGVGIAKYLLGVEGDRVEVQGSQVFLVTRRGRVFAGECKPKSRMGDALTPVAAGVIPPGYVYMWAPHPDALDSRYSVMGLVHKDRIVGRAMRLW